MDHDCAELQVNFLPAEALLLAEVSQEVISVDRSGCLVHLKAVSKVHVSEHRYMACLLWAALFGIDA